MPSPGQDQSNNLTDVLVTDHREVEQMFHALETGVTDPDERRRTVDKVIMELARHSVAEEQVLYPTARKVLSDGDEIVDHEIEEHAAAERTMAALYGKPADDPDFEPLLAELMARVREHVQDEERTLLPRLSTAAGLDATNRLGTQVAAAKKLAPTRPHPAAPDTPPGNVMNSLTGLMDQMRDALSGRGR